MAETARIAETLQVRAPPFRQNVRVFRQIRMRFVKFGFARAQAKHVVSDKRISAAALLLTYLSSPNFASQRLR
eukprot:6208047-Pleurochrysis_carterae.AAC.2